MNLCSYKKGMIKLLYILLFAICTLHARGQDLLSYEDATGLKKPVTTFEDWQLKRRQILEGLQKAMGELPDRPAFPYKVRLEAYRFIDKILEHNPTQSEINE